MGKLLDWLLQDEHKAAYDLFVALTLNLLFLGLACLLLWPLGQLPLAVQLARGYALLWLALLVTALLLHAFQRLLRMDMYRSAPAYVISTLLASSFLQAAWAAQAARVYRCQAAGTLWPDLLLLLLAGLSCYIAYVVVCGVFSGQIYRLAGLPFILICFGISCFLPLACP